MNTPVTIEKTSKKWKKLFLVSLLTGFGSCATQCQGCGALLNPNTDPETAANTILFGWGLGAALALLSLGLAIYAAIGAWWDNG